MRKEICDNVNYEYIRTEECEPVCGEDFCDNCGDCLVCCFDDMCYGPGESLHRWVVYEDELERKGG